MFDIDFICLIAREKVDGGVCGFLSLQRPKLKAADLSLRLGPLNSG
jgi:hypothetical protein